MCVQGALLYKPSGLCVSMDVVMADQEEGSTPGVSWVFASIVKCAEGWMPRVTQSCQATNQRSAVTGRKGAVFEVGRA